MLLTNRIRALRVLAGLSQDELAKRMGTTRSQLVKLERGERRLSEEWIRRAAMALGVAPAEVLDSEAVPLIGHVTGDGLVMFEEVGAAAMADNDPPPAPPESAPDMVSLVFTGAFGGAERNWFVYYQNRDRTPSEAAKSGTFCICRLPDGRTLVRKIHPGREAGLFHLYAPGVEPIFDTPVLWAAPVAWIKPR